MRNTFFILLCTTSLFLSAGPVLAADPIDTIVEVSPWPGSNVVSPRNVTANGRIVVGMARDSNGNLQACDGKCDTCDFSYDYVIGYYEGHDACYNEYH